MLWGLAVVGFLGVNGAFVYGLLRPDVLQQALSNPLALAFMVEAMLLMGALAYLLAKWQVNRLHWAWFVLLSLLGSMAFALPVVLLWPRQWTSGSIGARPSKLRNS
ncbi:MAG: hypothetical protein PVH96_10685 [Gemmatimonadota bacterium]